MSSELDEKIERNAIAPKKVKEDNREVEQHDLKDQIAAAKYLAAKTAKTKKHKGLYFSKAKFPGST